MLPGQGQTLMTAITSTRCAVWSGDVGLTKVSALTEVS